MPLVWAWGSAITANIVVIVLTYVRETIAIGAMIVAQSIAMIVAYVIFAHMVYSVRIADFAGSALDGPFV